MKILHVANFSLGKYGDAYYSTDRKISNGLIRNGHLVYEFSYRDVARFESPFKTTKLGAARRANQRLIETFRRFQPDLLLLGHSELITGETLNRIRELGSTTKIALWYVDALFPDQAIQHLVKRLACLDVVFATAGGKWLAKLKGPRSGAAFIPNPIDAAMECHENHRRTDVVVDLLFCGREVKGGSREEMLRKLQEKLTDVRFEIRGSLGQPIVVGHAYYQMLSESKMALNLSRRDDVHLYSSDRIAQLTGNGILAFTNRVPGFEMLYTEEEVAYFDSAEELVDKILYFQRNDDYRRQVAARGWQKAHASFNVQRVTQYMLEVIYDLPFSESYEWRNERMVWA